MSNKHTHLSPPPTLALYGKPLYRPCVRPRLRAKSHRRLRSPHLISCSYEKQLAVLVILLVVASFTCFGTAYYLLTASWHVPTAPWSHGLSRYQTIHLDFDPDLSAFPRSILSDEKYLAYSPHSGFHNQRIAFENALVLSRLLNRTLLVPPVRLGNKPLSYMPFDGLRNLLADSDKRRLGHCSNSVPPAIAISPECLDYFDYTHVPWEWLVDLTDIKSKQNLLQFWNFTDSWLEDRLGIDSNDTYALKDYDRNHYMFQDFKSYSSPPSRKYLQSVHLSTLAQRPERLIQLGTLFGSSRLHLRNAQNTLIRKHVRQNMAFTNPYLLHTATTIRDALGGLYLGAHIRLGDGLFQENARANVRLAWWKLLHFALKFSKADTLALEQRLFSHDVSAEFSSPPHIALDIPALRVPHPMLDPLPTSATPSLACPGALHTEMHLLPLNTPLFISTDALYPHSDPLLARFRQTFPCTFFLADFSAHTRALDALLNGVDGVTLAPFLLPFLDAMVVGRAWEVVGTEGSTFSAFVQDVLWRTYHGWDIVQRG